MLVRGANLSERDRDVTPIKTSLAALLLTGCVGVAATEADLRRNPHTRDMTTTTRNYRDVYRTVVANARRCWEGQMLGSSAKVVRADLYEDLQRGEVTLLASNPYRDAFFAAFEIRPEGEGTRVRVLVSRGGPLTEASRLDDFSALVQPGAPCRLP